MRDVCSEGAKEVCMKGRFFINTLITMGTHRISGENLVAFVSGTQEVIKILRKVSKKSPNKINKSMN